MLSMSSGLISTRPFDSMRWIVDRIFHEKAEDVKRLYLNHSHDDIYVMKPEFDTQKKIEAVFAAERQQLEAMNSDKKVLADHDSLRDGLYSLVSNVLFLRDRKDSNKFHPRISAQQDFTYDWRTYRRPYRKKVCHMVFHIRYCPIFSFCFLLSSHLY